MISSDFHVKNIFLLLEWERIEMTIAITKLWHGSHVKSRPGGGKEVTAPPADGGSKARYAHLFRMLWVELRFPYQHHHVWLPLQVTFSEYLHFIYPEFVWFLVLLPQVLAHTTPFFACILFMGFHVQRNIRESDPADPAGELTPIGMSIFSVSQKNNKTNLGSGG